MGENISSKRWPRGRVAPVRSRGSVLARRAPRSIATAILAIPCTTLPLTTHPVHSDYRPTRRIEHYGVLVFHCLFCTIDCYSALGLDVAARDRVVEVLIVPKVWSAGGHPGTGGIMSFQAPALHHSGHLAWRLPIRIGDAVGPSSGTSGLGAAELRRHSPTMATARDSALRQPPQRATTIAADHHKPPTARPPGRPYAQAPSQCAYACASSADFARW